MKNKPRIAVIGAGCWAEGRTIQMTHPTGLIFFVTGLRARSIQALMRNHGLAVDLVDETVVEFKGGVLGVVGRTGNAGGNHRLAPAVYGTQGCDVTDSLAQFFALRDQNGRARPLDGGSEPQQRYATTHNFIEVIQGKSENLAPGEVGWRTVELLDAAYRSAQRNGQPVLVEDLYQ